MKIESVTLEGKKGTAVELSDAVFAIVPRRDIMHRVVTWQRARKQLGNHKSKERAEISGTTAKMFRQKGTGNARHGMRKATQFRGGGTVFGPRVRSHAHSLPKKIRALGLKSALSAKAASGHLHIIDTLVIDKPATAQIKKSIEKLGFSKPLFVRGDAAKDAFYQSIQNLPYTDTIPEYGLNVYDILRHRDVVITAHALETLEKRLAS